jgi:prephenate dehydrogenase
MNPDDGFRRIGIVGLGLIGGSAAFAARRVFPDAVIVGVDRDGDVAIAARQLGAVHEAGISLDSLAGADLVLLAAPVTANIAALERLSGLLDPGAVVTDVGSTKRAMLDGARRMLPGAPFVGGHPLAGAARGGLEASRPDLFERRPWVLTPEAQTPRPAVARVATFVSRLGAVPIEIDPGVHDHVLAFTSHLPQLTASALMHVVGEAVEDSGLRLAGRGLADTTRVAASPVSIWRDICATNADEILPALDALIETLRQVRDDLAEGHPPDRVFHSAGRWRRKLDG